MARGVHNAKTQVGTVHIHINMVTITVHRVEYRIFFWRGEISQMTYFVRVYICDATTRILEKNYSVADREGFPRFRGNPLSAETCITNTVNFQSWKPPFCSFMK